MFAWEKKKKAKSTLSLIRSTGFDRIDKLCSSSGAESSAGAQPLGFSDRVRRSDRALKIRNGSPGEREETRPARTCGYPTGFLARRHSCLERNNDVIGRKKKLIKSRNSIKDSRFSLYDFHGPADARARITRPPIGSLGQCNYYFIIAAVVGKNISTFFFPPQISLRSDTFQLSCTTTWLRSRYDWTRT